MIAPSIGIDAVEGEAVAGDDELLLVREIGGEAMDSLLAEGG